MPLLSAGLLFLLFVVGHVRAQFNEPPGERREQTFRVLEFEDGTVNQHFDGTLRYYCTFRGKWTKERHPIDFPRSASWGPPIMISHSNGYRMWSGTEAATLGIESIAEVSSLPPYYCIGSTGSMQYGLGNTCIHNFVLTEKYIAWISLVGLVLLLLLVF